MSKSKKKGFLDQLDDSTNGILNIANINAIIALLTIIFGISDLKNILEFSHLIGEEGPNMLLMISPIPLSYIIIEIFKSVLLLTCGFTLLIKSSISIRLYHLYCIFIITNGFYIPINKSHDDFNGFFFLLTTPAAIAIILFTYFNQKRVVEVFSSRKAIHFKELIIYITASFAILILAYYFRSIFFEEYEFQFWGDSWQM